MCLVLMCSVVLCVASVLHSANDATSVAENKVYLLKLILTMNMKEENEKDVLFLNELCWLSSEEFTIEE